MHSITDYLQLVHMVQGTKVQICNHIYDVVLQNMFFPTMPQDDAYEVTEAVLRGRQGNENTAPWSMSLYYWLTVNFLYYLIM